MTFAKNSATSTAVPIRALRVLYLVAVLWFTLADIAQAQVRWALQPVTLGPPAVCCAGGAYMPSLGGVVIFGGLRANTHGIDTNQTWLWTDHWTLLSPPNSPPMRSGAGMAYDAANGNIVLFGGADDTTQTDLNDTWIFDGSNWTQIFPATVPQGRAFGVNGLNFDAATNNVIMYGGAGYQAGYLGDTWTWDGTNWTQQQPTSSPSPRRSPQAYDESTSTVILFGGDDAAGNHYNETWSWDGTTWTQISTANAPSPRTLSMVSYDAYLGKLVLFGGDESFTVVDSDTWTFNGTNWQQQFPPLVLLNRYAGSMAYDASTESVVMFGGFGYGGEEGRKTTYLLEPAP